MLDRAGYTWHPAAGRSVAADASSTSPSGRIPFIAVAAGALAGMLAAHARRFARTMT
jgi:hypothetical protein